MKCRKTYLVTGKPEEHAQVKSFLSELVSDELIELQI